MSRKDMGCCASAGPVRSAAVAASASLSMVPPSAFASAAASTWSRADSNTTSRLVRAWMHLDRHVREAGHACDPRLVGIGGLGFVGDDRSNDAHVPRTETPDMQV